MGLQLQGGSANIADIQFEGGSGNKTVVIPKEGGKLANVSSVVGFKNYIINGNFSIWQRGTSFTGLTNGSYSADRWCVYDSAGNINYSTIRNAGIFQSGYGINYTFNSGTGTRSIIQFIENVTRFKVGSKVSISFEAYTDSTPYNVGVAIQGVRGMWAAATAEVSQTITLTNTKTRYEVNLTVPDWSTLGINWGNLEDTKLGLKFILGTETNGRNFIISNVQLEEGSVATPFENRPRGLELSLCRRYYTHAGVGATGVEETASRVSFGIKFDTPMRTTPTIVVNPTVSWRVASADRLNVSVSVGGETTISDSGIWLYLIDSSNGSVAGRPIINRTAANFITASAEL